MKTHTYIPEEKLFQRAVEILMEKLGPAETRRFLSIAKPKRVESVKRHRQWQAKLDEKEFYDKIFGSEK